MCLFQRFKSHHIRFIWQELQQITMMMKKDEFTNNILIIYLKQVYAKKSLQFHK